MIGIIVRLLSHLLQILKICSVGYTIQLGGFQGGFLSLPNSDGNQAKYPWLVEKWIDWWTYMANDYSLKDIDKVQGFNPISAIFIAQYWKQPDNKITMIP